MTTQGFKMLTSGLRPPLRGGKPMFDGTFPVTLPTVKLDRSDAECGNGGYHFCADLATCIKIAGLWRTGRPNVAVLVEADDALVRGDKIRAASLRFLRFATTDEWREAVSIHSKPFGIHRDRMTEEQIAWAAALAQPLSSRTNVLAGLEMALKVRSLSGWTTKEYSSAWGARDARDAWDAWDAWGALTVLYAGLMGWTTRAKADPMLLTTGLRDAYRNGLAMALPTGPNELGFTMDKLEERP
jgi:hypothetical protein